MAWSAWETIPGFDLKELIYEKKYRDTGGGVARISFNRPQRMNALTNNGWNEIIQCIQHASGEKDIGVIVFSSIGDHFGTGGDVSWEAGGGLWAGIAGDFDAAVMDCPKPAIAAVKGYCIGGHNHLAYHCDFTIAADNAIFGQNGPRVGSPMGGYLVASAAHALGIKKAKEMWMLCRRYTAQEALQMGLVNAIVPLAKLEEEVDRWCDELLNIVPTCLAIVKKSFRAVDSTMESESNKAFSLIAPDIPLEALWEKLGSGEVKPSPQFLTEMAEAQKAFFEKRTANFWKRE